MLNIPIVLAIFIGFLSYWPFYFGNYRKHSNAVKVSLLALHVFILSLISVTILPIYYSKEAIAIKKAAAPKDLGIHLIPFTEMIRLFHADINLFLLNIVGNFLLLMPLAVILIFLKKSTFFSVSVIIAVSVFIESVQLLKNYLYGFRVNLVDIDDLILNISGALLVYFILFCFILRRSNNKEQSKDKQ